MYMAIGTTVKKPDDLFEMFDSRFYFINQQTRCVANYFIIVHSYKLSIRKIVYLSLIQMLQF